MQTQKLEQIVQSILYSGKGILAIDESPDNLLKKFKNSGIEQTKENAKKFREVMITTPNIQEYVGGVIFHPETFHQSADDGRTFLDILENLNIAPGIKLDKGLVDYNNSEKVSKGLDELEERLRTGDYLRAKFAKWRVVFFISESTPSSVIIDQNCKTLAEYAKICQSHGIVPIVEPEILYDGSHDIQQAKKTAKNVLSKLMYYLNMKNIHLPGVILKPSFVTQGKDSLQPIDVKKISAMTFAALIDTLPSSLGGIAFLSGGHKSTESLEFLDSLNNESGFKPWPLSFSFGRALSNCVLDTWRGNNVGIEKAQASFQQKLFEASLASQGKYKSFKKK